MTVRSPQVMMIIISKRVNSEKQCRLAIDLHDIVQLRMAALQKLDAVRPCTMARHVQATCVAFQHSTPLTDRQAGSLSPHAWDCWPACKLGYSGSALITGLLVL